MVDDSKRTPTRDPDVFITEDGTYYYRGTPPGTNSRVERSLKTKNPTEAKVRKHDLVDKLSRVGATANRFRTGKLMDDHVKDREIEFTLGRIRKVTFQETKATMEQHIRPFFGKYKLEDIDESLFDRYCLLKGKRDFRNHRKVLTTFLKWCRKKRFIRYVPVFELPDWKKRERAILTPDEITSLFKYAEGQINLYLMMYLFMGMRNTEIVKLEWSRVDFENRTIELGVNDTKTKLARTIPINSRVLDLLQRERKLRLGQYVFPNRRGVHAKVPHLSRCGFYHVWVKLLDRAGIKRHITPHDLRATWETYAHMNPNFTATQLEKMAGAAIDVQRAVYVKMGAENLRGLEEAVQVEGLYQAIDKKIGGNSGGRVLQINRKDKRK